MRRSEYPRPQLVRSQWLNLNGEWSFEFDDLDKGVQERWYDNNDFSKKIQVPFAFQTPLSGIHDCSFHDYCWYSKTFAVPEDMKGKQIILHFGAVDYLANVYVNSELVGTHEGGHTSFSFDITHCLLWKEETVTVRVFDPSTDETIPRGKQHWEEKSAAIWYNRTTGIWQTVWIEAVNKTHIQDIRFTPNIDEGNIEIEADIAGDFMGKTIEFVIGFNGQTVAKKELALFESYTKSAINLFGMKVSRSHMHRDGWLWSPDSPNLFDIKILLKDGETTLDDIDSYFGMRKVHTRNGMVYLNNRPFYQKLVLDQGYWPEGLLTAPTDEALKQDILLAKEMGFNGARKHQKVEDPRYLYWADKLGFIAWGECAATQTFSGNAVARLTREWIEIIRRDYNHPCIITWVPINESWGVSSLGYNPQQTHHTLGLYYLIKSLDKTRLVVSNDGWEMTKTDICAIHNYNHGHKYETEKYKYFKESLATKENILASRHAHRELFVEGFRHDGEPILLTEFGGIGFKASDTSGWGYTTASNEDEFLDDYKRVMEALYASKVLSGFCYTQLTDVEQEINGILTYNRKPKCDLDKIRVINDTFQQHY